MNRHSRSVVYWKEEDREFTHTMSDIDAVQDVLQWRNENSYHESVLLIYIFSPPTHFSGNCSVALRETHWDHLPHVPQWHSCVVQQRYFRVSKKIAILSSEH